MEAMPQSFSLLPEQHPEQHRSSVPGYLASPCLSPISEHGVHLCGAFYLLVVYTL